ncbi:hypothetical protein QJQ45_018140 [Haematococcus lacustris]|nr:hypothetical protein QJQ45_018140 [Haematococcus lacustris]
MGRRSQRNKNASAKMAAQVAAGLAPWTLCPCCPSPCVCPSPNSSPSAVLSCMYVCVMSCVVSCHVYVMYVYRCWRRSCKHPRRSMAHPARPAARGQEAIVLLVAGLCAQTGASAIGFDSKGDKPYITMGPLPALVQLPALVGPEAASKAAGCSASPNYPASSSLPPPTPQSVQPGSAFHCCLGSVHLESHDAEHQCAKLIDSCPQRMPIPY